MTNLEIVKGYFEALKRKKSANEFILLSYVELNLVSKDISARHSELVKGKEKINIEIVSETEQSAPYHRTIVVFKLNGDLFKAVIQKELKPASNFGELKNWLNAEGKPGINPYSIKRYENPGA